MPDQTVERVLERLGLLDFAALLVGLQNQRVKAHSIVQYAQHWLERVPSETSQSIIRLAGADPLRSDEVERLLLEVISSSDVNTTRELNKWRLGELLMLEAQRLPSEQTVDRLQELYAQFGYPSDMRLVSRYRASQWAFDHGRADREDLTIGPLEAMRRVIHSLGADLGVQPDLIEDTLK